MTPRLILLTGPAAGEVAQALRPESCERCDVSMDPCSLCPVRLGFEVRDYWYSLYVVYGGRPGFTNLALSLLQDMEKRIRSLPGGEEWLAGLVLPGLPTENRRYSNAWKCYQKDGPSEEENLPARLAILAPDLYNEHEDYTDESGRARIRKVPLLVERVKAWGGEVWHCSYDSEQEWPQVECPAWHHPTIVSKTWPEAVRAALGEES